MSSPFMNAGSDWPMLETRHFVTARAIAAAYAEEADHE
jgi:hypothetical protein